jgi:hypothetical protein
MTNYHINAASLKSKQDDHSNSNDPLTAKYLAAETEI